MRRLIGIVVIIGMLFPALALAQPQSNPAAIASAHPLATQAGFDILANGGNAFDAAVAVSAALAVVEPYSSGIGGGGFWLLHRANDNLDVMIDGREKAPGAASATMYQDKNGKVVPHRSLNGALAAGIPGEPAALAWMSKHYGNLALSTTLAPAIVLAKQGFPADEHYRGMARFRLDTLRQFPASKAILLDQGKVPDAGSLIIQKQLAHTLQQLANQGHKGFYTGTVAKKLVKGVQAEGGIWTLDDLKNYRIVERTPVIGHYKGARIVSASPPSSGGIVLLEALHILEQLGEKATTADQPHYVVEALRRAYHDRAVYLGDADFIDVPVDRLLSVPYAKTQAASIADDHATPSRSLGKPITTPQGKHTTHFSILDQYGNYVAATLSVNYPFGSGLVVPGTGVLLNDEMDDFSAKPGTPNAYGLVGSHANSIEAKKRPLSSMTPTFVQWDNKVAILGTPGGSRIISMVMLGVLEALKGTPPSSWVALPRYHEQYLPDEVQLEPQLLTSDLAKRLKSKGNKIVSTGRNYGNMQAILWDKANKKVEAAADPRGMGEARVQPQASTKKQSLQAK